MISEVNATHVVTHPFDGGDKKYTNGDRVNASAWRNADKLVNSKFLRPLTVVEVGRRLSAVDSPKPAPKKVLKLTIKKK